MSLPDDEIETRLIELAAYHDRLEVATTENGDFLREVTFLVRSLRQDAERLDKLDDLIVQSAGRKFYLGPDEKEGHLYLDAWGSSDIRELIDATPATSQEKREP